MNQFVVRRRLVGGLSTSIPSSSSSSFFGSASVPIGTTSSPLGLVVEERRSRGLHTSSSNHSIGLVGGAALLAVGAYGSSLVLQSVVEARKKRAEEAAKNPQPEGGESQEQQQQAAAGASSSGFFSIFSFSKGFYDGGFEEKMTRREAALILGVRETATREKIRDAHRRVAMLNHPDQGGSPFLAQKINEAKEVLTGAAGDSRNN